MNADEFGFYTVNERKTYSKMEAFEWAKYDFSKIHWDFNKKVFSLYDWTKEPVEDVNYFYDKRVKELRQQYDYIIFFYSGGYDSHNILKTFIDNNIHIDEIIKCIPRKDIMNEENYEYQNYTKKKLEKYSNELKNTKINIVEYADDFFKTFNAVEYDDILYGHNSKFSVFHIMKNEISKKLVPYHKKIVSSGKKVCYLFGIDKPRVVYKNNNFFCLFDDAIAANYILAKEQMDCDFEIATEFFYWSTTCIPLIIKQVQLLKKQYSDILNTNVNLFLDLTRNHEFSGSYKPKYNSTTNHIRLLSFKERFEFHGKTEIQNMTLYPRCYEDRNLGYFFNGTESEYHKSVEGILGSRELMEKYRIYRCMGTRNTWLYLSNSDASIKMRKIIENVTNRPQLFIQNDVYKNTKILRNEYKL
jgi:hypothetical protein